MQPSEVCGFDCAILAGMTINEPRTSLLQQNHAISKITTLLRMQCETFGLPFDEAATAAWARGQVEYHDGGKLPRWRFQNTRSVSERRP